jgi:hypothetical protein
VPLGVSGLQGSIRPARWYNARERNLDSSAAALPPTNGFGAAIPYLNSLEMRSSSTKAWPATAKPNLNPPPGDNSPSPPIPLCFVPASGSGQASCRALTAVRLPGALIDLESRQASQLFPSKIKAFYSILFTVVLR